LSFKASGKVINSACLACPEKPCYKFTEEESKLESLARERCVCPMRAIQFDTHRQTIVINDQCIGCGLCIFRCPYGAIYYSDDGKAIVAQRSNSDFRNATPEEFSNCFEGCYYKIAIPTSERNQFLQLVHKNLRKTKQNEFYPIVGKYLNALGFPTKVTRTGDTNIRMDAKMLSGHGFIPIEIKSPTETEKVSIKAVRQALENKIILLSREREKKVEKPVTSLIIGYEKPNERSDRIRRN